MAQLQAQKITPYLWYDNQALEAAEFYCSLFDNAKIIANSGMLVEFELEGMSLIALNGGPQFKFNEAVSFFVLCDGQEEVDHFWNAFTADGGEESMCGWCRDKYGLFWQIIPKQLIEMMKSTEREKSKRAMDSMLKMRKIVVADLQQAYHG